MSYAHEYCLPGGKKSMLAFSKPFSLARFAPKRWVIAPEDLHWLMDELDASPHVPVAPTQALRAPPALVAKVELKAQEVSGMAGPAPRQTQRSNQSEIAG